MKITDTLSRRLEEVISEELLFQYWGTAGTGETEAQYITRMVMTTIIDEVDE